MKKALALAAACLAFLAGCATSTPIQLLSESQSNFFKETTLLPHSFPAENIYRIYHRAATGFVSLDSIRQAAEERAERFARGQGKKVVFLGEQTSSPPHILGNFPRIEVIFAVTEEEPASSTKYDLLTKLKKLLDDGAISQAEYDLEKAKVLARDK